MQGKDKKKIYILISILIVLILIIAIIIICSLLLNNDNGYVEHEKEENPLETLEEGQYYKEKEGNINEFEFNDITDRNLFFRIEDCLQLYYKYLDIDNYEEQEYVPGSEESFASMQGITSDKERNQLIINLLSEKYINDNKISTDNLYDFVKPIDLGRYKLQVIKEKVYTNKNVRNYYVVAKVIDNNNYEVTNTLYYIINSNIEDDSFSIYPLEQEPDNIYNYINDEKIEPKDNNQLQTKTIKDLDMALKYFSDFKMNAMHKTEYAFKLLDDEYREKRFNNDKNKFDTFIDNNIQEWAPITITQYLVNDYDGYKEYVCKDKYENVYIFKEIGIMEYTVKLDNYTIMTDKFKEEYEKSDEQNKVMMNIDKWIQMLNNRDYTSAYNMLDETFKNNKFNGDENVFEEYMRNKYPLHYKASYVQFKKQSGDIYVQQVFLLEIGGETEQGEEINIVMKLEGDTEFVMSFEV